MIPVVWGSKCSEVALYPDVVGQMDREESAACNYDGMQEQFQNTIQREKGGKKIFRRKAATHQAGSDSMQQAALNMAEEPF